MEFRNLNPIRYRPGRRRASAGEVGIAAAALVVPPLVIGAALYSTLAPFDDAAALPPPSQRARSDPAPAEATRDAAVTDELRMPSEVAPLLTLAPMGAEPPPAAAAPPRRTAAVHRRAQRPHEPPPQPRDDGGGFQQVKGWLQNTLRDIGVVSRDGDDTR